MAREHRGNNLFSLDLEAIERVLSDANAGLVEEVRAHLDRHQSLLQGGPSPESAAALHQFREETKALLKKVGKVRLQDGRPFTDATKTIKAWFDGLERDLKRADAELRDRLDHVLSTAPASGAEPARGPEEIGHARNAGVIVMAHSDAGGPVEARVPREWTVSDFDREKMDFNALRDHFTDHAIRSALDKHLKAAGPNLLEGVDYILGVKK
ncbi:hypothetical protein [Paenirhodobacter sp.]|uniref:hypothetical protein n=1 Tax=Paenirhodobacter sp. TaxID=1965326 RepID=UPI003B3F956B